MNRFRATAIHLSISVTIGVLLLGLFWWVWYPPPLFRAIGGRDIFLLLLGVDVALGPLLTLIVYKPGKKSLRFDLAVIALVQTCALAYGVWTLLVGRPVYVAALGHRFDVIQASEIAPENIAKAAKPLPWFGPEWVGVKMATDAAEKERMMLSGLEGFDYGHFPQYHQPLASMRAELLRNAKAISELASHNPDRKGEIETWLSARGRTPLDTVYQGLRARSEDMAVMIDKSNCDIIGIAPFTPWR